MPKKTKPVPLKEALAGLDLREVIDLLPEGELSRQRQKAIDSLMPDFEKYASKLPGDARGAMIEDLALHTWFFYEQELAARMLVEAGDREPFRAVTKSKSDDWALIHQWHDPANKGLVFPLPKGRAADFVAAYCNAASESLTGSPMELEDDGETASTKEDDGATDVSSPVSTDARADLRELIAREASALFKRMTAEPFGQADWVYALVRLYRTLLNWMARWKIPHDAEGIAANVIHWYELADRDVEDHRRPPQPELEKMLPLTGARLTDMLALHLAQVISEQNVEIIDGGDVTVDTPGGKNETGMACPTPTAPSDDPALNASEQCIIDAVREHGSRLTTEKLLHKAFAKVNSHGKQMLSSLMKRGKLTNSQNENPPGYGLPEWSGPRSGPPPD